MMIEIIKGAIGSGKSSYIIESIKEKLKTDDKKHIIIVPEQFSYATEKLVVGAFGGAGLNNVEVMTLSRLVSRCLTGALENHLTPSGKMMIVYRAVMSVGEESLFWGSAKKPGFLEACAKMLSEFTQYMITPEVLRDKAEVIENNLLREKLKAMADILDKYNNLIKGRFLDSREDILRLAEYAEQSNAFSEYRFWFDEFSVFLPQHYRVMEGFLKGGADLHISVCSDSRGREMYDVNRGIIKRIEKLSQKVGAELSVYATDDVCRRIESKELLYLLENIDRFNEPGFTPMEEETKDISLYVCRDLYAEVRHVALSIRRLVMEQGYRYGDISVVCGNAGGYTHIVEAVFNDYNIPYFADVQMPAAEHPVSFMVMAAWDILLENWSYASVFRYLRAGYIFTKDDTEEIYPLDDEGIDLLENYVLKYGIRGKSMWTEDEKWEKSQKGIFEGVLGKDSRSEFSEVELEKINYTRKVITEPFLRLYEKISGRRTVREFAKAFFEFLGDLNLFGGLEKRANEMDSSGLRNEAEQLRMIWNVLTETINQAVVVMGEEKCSREEFSGLLTAGLSALDVSIIPTGIDRVSVSSVERSRQQQPKVMFIMGALFGEIPKETQATGILTDSDRITLREVLSREGMDIAADTNNRNEMDRFNFFATLFGVSERVHITYPAADAEGNVARPSTVISELYRVFPNMTTGDNIIDTNQEEFLYAPSAAYNFMLANYKRKGVPKDIYSWYEDNQPQKLEVIKKAGEYKKNAARITPENAKKLYQDRQYNISRINEYGKCPFGYFVKYGLKAKEQPLWKIQKFDLGSIMHIAVEMYCRRVDNNADSFEQLRENWLSLTKEESDAIVIEVMEDIRERIVDGISRDENKIRYIIMRLTRIVKRSVELVKKSLSLGEYTAVCYEQKFRTQVKWKDSSVIVNGVIDRVDMAKVQEEKIAELRVVDYKTGKKNFSVVSICNRRDIQLVMYAIAAVEMYKSGGIRYADKELEPRMRAVVYNNMHYQPVAAKNQDEGESLLKKENRADGLLVLEENLDDKLAYDLDSLIRMDSTLENSNESEIFRLGLKKDKNPTEKSQVAPSSAFDILMDYVKKSVIEIDDEIFDGVIKICPGCEGDKKTCAFCDFQEICLYNEIFDDKNEMVTDQKEAWEIMKKEVRGDE